MPPYPSPIGAGAPKTMPPEELLLALQTPSNFMVFRSTSDIPESVRTTFATAAHEATFKMAEPGSRWWNATDTGTFGWVEWPTRRLFAGALSDSICLLFYERGGFGRTYNVAVFRLSGLKAEPIWHAYTDSTVTNPASLAKATQELAHGDTNFY